MLGLATLALPPVVLARVGRRPQTLVRDHEKGNDAVHVHLAIQTEATIFAEGACHVPVTHSVYDFSCTKQQAWQKHSRGGQGEASTWLAR